MNLTDFGVMDLALATAAPPRQRLIDRTLFFPFIFSQH
jgi:hypothetical protein